MSEPETIIVWQQNNAKVETDVEAMWQKHNALPPGADPKRRLKALAAAVYIDGNLAAVASAGIAPEPRLGGYKFASWRVFVVPEYRNTGIARSMNAGLMGIPLLEEWALAHPEEDVAGFMLVLENTAVFAGPGRAERFRTKPEEPDDIPPIISQKVLKPEAPIYEQVKESPMVFCGYNGDGKAIFVRWFPHILVKVVKPQE